MKLFWSFIIACWLTSAFLFGILYGYDVANSRLPDCQEDEYLRVGNDYTGPGNNVTSDYVCIHIDSIQGGE